MTDHPTVAVVGAGFSGLLTALRLLLNPEGPRVTLIERGPRFGRGAAYATGNPGHLLNVRATNMSALVEQPNHFLDWLGAAGVAAPDRVFVTRDRYGQYLQSLLREAAADRVSGRLTLEHDEVTAVTRDGRRWRLSLAMGRTIVADAVVLAMGNLPPHPPRGLDPALERSDRYVADPWAWAGPHPSGGDELLILGSGLTAIDIALSIDLAQPRARITALSRHGLLPRVHGEALPAATLGGAPAGPPAAIMAEVRRRAEVDWRGAVDGLRPHVQAIWRGWPLADRRRFLRHLAAWWNVHRHRMAPEVAAKIDALREASRFDVAAGRIDRMTLEAGAVEVVWTPRGQTTPKVRRVAQVINCSGPRGDLARSGDTLIGALLAEGLVRPDACRLGLDVDARSRVIGASGEAAESLFAVGPLTRGQFYEITSVPDIRLQAADCADSILNHLVLKTRAAAPPAAERLADELAGFLQDSMAELDVELGSLKFARRMRNAWELRGRRAAFDEIALWLDERRAKAKQ
jgi:uncharacterized NAD(P)/FAD-binding protein YdhS